MPRERLIGGWKSTCGVKGADGIFGLGDARELCEKKEKEAIRVRQQLGEPRTADAGMGARTDDSLRTARSLLWRLLEAVARDTDPRVPCPWLWGGAEAARAIWYGLSVRRLTSPKSHLGRLWRELGYGYFCNEN